MTCTHVCLVLRLGRSCLTIPHTTHTPRTQSTPTIHPLSAGTVGEYLLNFGPYYLLHTLVALLAHSRLGWRKGLRYLWRAQQEPVYLLFTFIRASGIVALGLPVRACVRVWMCVKC